MAIEQAEFLDAATRAAVVALATSIEHRDGEPPLSDQALTRLGSPAVEHHLARQGDSLVGYAQVDAPSAEIAGDPESARALLGHVLARVTGTAATASGATSAAQTRLLVWSHGQRSPLGPELAQRGFERARVLHQLRRPLTEPLPAAALAAGVTVREFAVGSDEDAWLRVNAAAFAGHAEQGRWTIEDLRAREAESWFDPHGFLIAERDEKMIGFHWTKVHADGVGEVYVLGIDPSAQGLGLGPALLVRGLDHLARGGSTEAMLYVDDDNAAAMRLYERIGFVHHDIDVQWAAPDRRGSRSFS